MRVWKNKDEIWLDPMEPDFMTYYIEEVLGLRKDGDSILLTRMDHPEDPGCLIRLVGRKEVSRRRENEDSQRGI